MKSIQLPAPGFANAAGVIAVGAMTGAVAGVAGVLAYGLLAGKGATSALMAKTALGAQASGSSGMGGWLGLLVPASTGAVGGGVSSVGVARKAVQHEVQEARDQFEQQADQLREQIRVLTPAPQTAQTESKADELEQIKGIGPRFARLLQEAGVHTLEALAQADPAELHAALETLAAGKMARPESWINQAQALVAQRKPAV